VRLPSLPSGQTGRVCDSSQIFHSLSCVWPTHSVRMHRRIQRHCLAHGRHSRARWRKFELHVPILGNFVTPLRHVWAAKILCAIITGWALKTSKISGEFSTWPTGPFPCQSNRKYCKRSLALVKPLSYFTPEQKFRFRFPKSPFSDIGLEIFNIIAENEMNQMIRE
jgi:hypothetical protein